MKTHFHVKRRCLFAFGISANISCSNNCIRLFFICRQLNTDVDSTDINNLSLNWNSCLCSRLIARYQVVMTLAVLSQIFDVEI